jgi:subtilisin
MKKLIAILACFLLTGIAVAIPSKVPLAERAKEVARAPLYSYAIDEDWSLLPYYVLSDDAMLKAIFGVRHEFPGAFSTDLSRSEVALLRLLGIEIRPVQIYYVNGKPICGNGVIEGGEKCGEPSLPECPEGYYCRECRCMQECYPDSQYPWGILKVNGGSGGEGVVVAVLDTGIDTDHPDLQANIVDCVTMVTRTKPDTKSCEDAHGHGTHVAGTVAANGGPKGNGIYGVAPGASLMAIKVCDRKGWCYADDIATGIRYAADQGANIISMSFGGDDPDYEILQAIDYAIEKGLLAAAAAGNDGPELGSIDYPGGYVKVIAAGAIRSDESVPDWSSRGVNDGDWVIEEREVEFGSPGVYVESTYKDGCYAYMSGTSMAAPHLSGLAAKLWQGNAADTRSYLQSIARDIWYSGDDPATGFGLPVAP